MSHDPDKERLKALVELISGVKKSLEPAPRADEHYSTAQTAWRMVIELVAGLVIGFGIGYGLDSLFGTLPLFLVIFILLGLAAGVKTMMRTAQELQTEAEAKVAKEQKAREGEEKKD